MQIQQLQDSLLKRAALAVNYVIQSVLKGVLRKLNDINLNYLLFDIIISEAGSFNLGEYIESRGWINEM